MQLYLLPIFSAQIDFVLVCANLGFGPKTGPWLERDELVLGEYACGVLNIFFY